MKRSVIIIAIITAAVFSIASCGNVMNDMLNELNKVRKAGLFTVTYDANGSTAGSVPEDAAMYAEGETVTVLGNTGGLGKDSNTFAGWNTAADGSGLDYAEGDTFPMGAADVTLFANWSLVPVNGVSIDKNSTTIPRGHTEELTASVEPDNAADAGISWESSNTDAATVDADGVVTAVEGGTATITVTTADGGFTAECNVEVITPPTTQAAKLLADDGAFGDNFGCSVSVSGACAVIGAINDDDFGTSSGSAYIFERDASGNWQQVQKLLASDGDATDLFGNSTAIIDGCAFIGARDAEGRGSAYVFERDSFGNWNQTAKLTASDRAVSDYFGASIAASGDYVIVGADGDDDFGSSSGSAYVFEKPDSGWTDMEETAKLTASDGAYLDLFGRSVAINGNNAFVGAPSSDTATGPGSGTVYVFRRDSSGNWQEKDILIASDDGVGDERFGYSMELSGDYAVIGAWFDNNGGSRQGSAYIFKKDNAGNWIEEAILTASDAENSDHFGTSVAISGTYAVIGTSYAGAAYVFERDIAGNWSEVEIITPSDSTGYFGRSVAVYEGYALIGAQNDNDNGSHSGAVYVFE